MKRVLLFCLFSIAFIACKKEKEEVSLPLKLKAVSTTNSSSINQKITFLYDQNGNLESAKKYKNGILENYLAYTYEAGVLTGARSYLKNLIGNDYNLISDVKFTYVNNRLSEISIHPVLRPAPSQPTKYVFEYGHGEIPIKIKLVLFDGSILESNNDYMISFPFRLTADSGSDNGIDHGNSGLLSYGYESAAPTTSAQRYEYANEFDNRYNPYYKLPWLSAEIINNEICYIFSPTSFFNRHNRTKRVVFLNGSPLYTYLTTHAYSAVGYPEKSTTIEFPGNYKYETTYEYW